MMNGLILKIDSTDSYVYDLKSKEVILCKAKGNIKKSKIKPIVGDYVEYELIDNGTGYIISISKRKSEIYRPKMANLDQVFLVSSVKEPNLGTYIIDKYVAFLELSNIKPILIFTKIDLLKNDDNKIRKIINDYKKIGYQVLELDNNNPSKETLKKIEEIMTNKISIFIGQTGAGKTSTLNNFLNYEDKQKTQEISKSLNRGKHTTTNVSIYTLEKNIFIADSPGFSSFELKNVDQNKIAWAFPIFEKYLGQCKFNNCLHIKEIGCAIKQAVENNEIPEFLYEDYLKIQEENKGVKY